MKISVIGTGYVGLIQAVGLAKIGFQVQALDIFPDKIALLKSGTPTIFENGLQELLKETLPRINFTTDLEATVGSDIIFLCVGTPQDEKGKTDLTYIKQASLDLKKVLSGNEIIVIKSTVPAGTNALIFELLGNKNPVVSNPEFLREGLAIEDFFTPERVVLGFRQGENEQVKQKLLLVYKYFQEKKIAFVLTDWQTAELIKYAANAFLATKITFINEIARLSDSLEANIKDVAYALGLDGRIGNKFLNAGVGYGGSCFPKDVKSLIHQFHDHGLEGGILSKVDETNATQIEYFLNKIFNVFDGNLSGKTFGILGVAFKPDTDDLRESRALPLINELIKAGAKLLVFDYNPKALENFEKYSYSLSTGIRNFIPITLTKSFQELANHTDALIITLEDPRILDEDLSSFKQQMKQPYIFDGKNILDREEMKQLGFAYYGVGC